MNTPEKIRGGSVDAPDASPAPASLTKREREILGRLATGMSGAQIAAELVLSPETVRTHVRNAMVKLGASTRSQAVALALQSRQIASDTAVGASRVALAQPSPVVGAQQAPALAKLLSGVVSLYDVDAGAIYIADEDGLALRAIAESESANAVGLPPAFTLGEGGLGRAALERRAQLLAASADSSSSSAAMIAAPMIGAGRLLGVIALAARVSRPIGRRELLLLQAFANRVGEVIVAGGNVDDRLERAMSSFRTSWSATRASSS